MNDEVWAADTDNSEPGFSLLIDYYYIYLIATIELCGT
jgi:hypothetical protein